MVTAMRTAALLVAMAVVVMTGVVGPNGGGGGGGGGGVMGASVAATDARHRMEEWMSDNHTLPEVEEVRASRRRSSSSSSSSSSSEGADDAGGSGSSGGSGSGKGGKGGAEAGGAGSAAAAAATAAAAAMEAGYGADGRINRSAVASAARQYYDEAVRAEAEEEEEEAPPRFFTLVLIKPDGVERGLVGEVLSRFERKQLRFAASAVVAAPSRELVEAHYDEHRKTKFFASLVDYMTSGPVHAFVVESPNERVVELVRLMLGPSDVLKAEPGTVRGDFAIDGQRNTVHASADRDAARREIALWFPDFEIPETPEPESSILTRIFNRVLGSHQAPPQQHHHHNTNNHHHHSASHAYTVRASK